MNYRHIFHAGNFADVFKHIILLILVKFLQKKDSPLCYLDTHAGIGRYDLLSEAAQKTKEYENGIMKLIAKNPANKWIQEYLKFVKDINNSYKALKFYPGSPLIVSSLLRSKDKMILSELHNDDFKILQNEFKNNPKNEQIAVHHTNGYLSLKAFLPPKEKRGLILIDPPFEEKNEFDEIISSLKIALARFKNGVYMIWYPIKDRPPVKKFHDDLTKLLQEFNLENKLITEFKIHEEEIATRLNGAGIVIINPPWKINEEIAEVIKNLAILSSAF